MQPIDVVIGMIEPPLPFGNAASRWFYVLFRELVRRGHRVQAFASASKDEEISQSRDLFPSDQYNLRCYPHPTARSLRRRIKDAVRPYSYPFSDEMFRDMGAAQRRADIVHLEQFWASWLSVRGLEHKTLFNLHNLMQIDLEHVRSPLRSVLERERMARTENYLMRRMRHVRLSTPRLIPYLRKIQPKAEIDLVSLAVDPANYDYIPDDARSGEPVVSVIGSMSWYPTLSASIRFLERLWPVIRREVPNARAQLVGWGAKSALARFVGTPGVTIDQDVPTTRPYFENTSVLLYAPQRGSGMKIKILEALAYGVPIVTTSEGAEGLPAVDGTHMGICEDDEGLIRRTIALLRDLPAQNRQRAAGRQLLETHCSPGVTVDAVEAIYEKMLSRTRR